VPRVHTNPKGDLERLCLRHCIKGWGCGYGAGCTHPHPTTFSSIDRVNQEKLAQWVRTTEDIKFLPGEGPSVFVRLHSLPPIARSKPASTPQLAVEARVSESVAAQLQHAQPVVDKILHGGYPQSTRTTPATEILEEHPKYSDILRQPSPAAATAAAGVSCNYSRRDLDAFAARTLHPCVQEVLAQPFDFSEVQVTADLELFPAESRALTAPRLVALQKTVGGPTRTPKETRSLRSRCLFYFKFAHDMKWDVDDGADITWERRRMTLQLALFALHLCSGASFLCNAIKAATIRQYLADVSTVLRRLDRLQRDFHRDRDSDTRLSTTITAVLKEIER
jgi:hypothetical protein